MLVYLLTTRYTQFELSIQTDFNVASIRDLHLTFSFKLTQIFKPVIALC
jgi:hypothetical protein